MNPRESVDFIIPLFYNTSMDDIRWKQRFQNYKKALATIKNALELAEKMSSLE